MKGLSFASGVVVGPEGASGAFQVDELSVMVTQISNLLSQVQVHLANAGVVTTRDAGVSSRTATVGSVRALRLAAPPVGSPRPLTDRELEVLGLVAKGLPNGEIAKELVLSPHTIHRHVSNIMTKLDVPSRAAAAAKAAALGLLRAG